MNIETPEIKNQERKSFGILLAVSACALIATVLNAQAVVTPEDSSDSRVCFGADAHARCFVLSGDELAQSVRGGLIQHQKLNLQEQTQVKRTIADYKEWSKTRHTEKDRVARTQALIKALEQPKRIASASASTVAPSPAAKSNKK